MPAFIKKLVQQKILLLSVLCNIVLACACLVFFEELRETYIELRYFRAHSLSTSNATTSKPADNTIILFGDSRIELWNPLPPSTLYRFVNAGIGGETTVEMRRRFERDVIRLKPDYVLIQAGVNDLTAAVTRGMSHPDKWVSDLHENIRYFVSSLESEDVEVIVSSIIPAKPLSLPRKLFWTNHLTEQINKANHTLEQMTLEEGADWLELDTLYLDGSGNTRSELFTDTLHINQRGYELLNQQLANYLKNQ